MRSQFTSFGSVPVGATSMYRLLQNGEMVLLFPGGAREALKKRGENYELFWSGLPLCHPVCV
jgi:putative hemolysin